MSLNRKRIIADWGVYQVYIEYDPNNINDFEVFYRNPIFTADHTPYRKLTKPEIRAALEAIYNAEKMKIMPVENEKKVDVQRMVPNWRDELAKLALSKLLEKLPLTSLMNRKKMEAATEMSYIIADMMLEAREPVVEKCKECGQKK